MGHFRNFVLLLVLVGFVVSQETPDVDPDSYHNITELIKSCGYPVEEHEIVTEDDYLISIFRIPHGKNEVKKNDDKKKAILMMHGLFGSAEHFVVGGFINRSLAFYCADHGYDVWLGNARGNIHGRKHKKLDPSKSKFWMFTWHEIGLYDVSAMIDHILETTGLKKIFYSGHSQGGTVFYVLNSLRPAYQEKIAEAFLLAPGGSQKNFKNPLLGGLAKNYKTFMNLAKNGNFYEFPPHFLNLGELVSDVCLNSAMKSFCDRIFFVMAGADSHEFDMRMLPIILRFLSTVSSLQLIHYAQIISSGRFRQYDYGKKENMKIYGTPEPSDYPVENIKIPTIMFYSLADNLAHAKDVEEICGRIPGCFKKHLMKNQNWTHFDFLGATNLDEEISGPIVNYMDTFNET